MAFVKLNKKDFRIAVKTGAEADIDTKFVKNAVKGEFGLATDGGRLVIATTDTGDSTDAETLNVSTFRTLDTGAQVGTDLEMTDFGRIFNANNTAVTYDLVQGKIKAGFVCYFFKSEAGGSLTITCGSNCKINNGTTNYVKSNAFNHLITLVCYKDDEVTIGAMS